MNDCTEAADCKDDTVLRFCEASEEAWLETELTDAGITAKAMELAWLDTELTDAGMTASAMLDACDETELTDAGSTASAIDDACEDTELTEAGSTAKAMELACDDVAETESWTLDTCELASTAFESAVELATADPGAFDLAKPFASTQYQPVCSL